MVYANSISDLFQELLPVEFIQAVVEITLPNVWWGVSVENRRNGLPRVGRLLAAPTRTRFQSTKPLPEGIGTAPLAGIEWVVVGGESGPGARPVDEA